MKEKFTTWYSKEVQKQINPGNSDANGELNVNYRLTALKPPMLHGWWTCTTISAVILVGATSLKGGKRLALPYY